MNNLALSALVQDITTAGEITAQHVKAMRYAALPDGITTRDEADMLIALDRAVPQADRSWAEYLHAEVVDFVVWTSRPTGTVDAETAGWLVRSLTGRHGPTSTAARIAFEIVREADEADEELIAFVLANPQARTERRPAPRIELAA